MSDPLGPGPKRSPEHVVLFSGGLGSWAAAKRVASQHGTDGLVLLFTDTKIEDSDLYRFLVEAAEDVGGELIRIADGRTPWQVFRAERLMGNTRHDPCSKILKRQLTRKWLKAHATPEHTTIYVGMSFDEVHRFGRAQSYWQRNGGWTIRAPLIEDETLTMVLADELAAAGIDLPRLYRLGFAHNNCGGFCVKAGIGHFARLLEVLPDVYAHHEREERAFREWIGKDVSILRDRKGGTVTPLTLEQLRLRIQCGGQVDMFDIGGCGCFTPPEDDDD